MGSPSAEKPAGTEAAGCPLALMGIVNAPLKYWSGNSEVPDTSPG